MGAVYAYSLVKMRQMRTMLYLYEVFSAKEPYFSGSFAKRDLHFEA